MKAWRQEYGARGFELIAVHRYNFAGQQPLPDALKELKIDYPVAHDESRATWRAFGMLSYPSHVLIGPDGTIVSRSAGIVTTNEIRNRIEGLLTK